MLLTNAQLILLIKLILSLGNNSWRKVNKTKKICSVLAQGKSSGNLFMKNFRQFERNHQGGTSKIKTLVLPTDL